MVRYDDLFVETLSYHDTKRLLGTLLRDDIMPIIADTARYVSNRVTIIQVNEEQLPGSHTFQLELRLDEIVGTNDPAKIQFFVGRVNLC